MKLHACNTCPLCKADDLLYKRALKALLAFNRARTKRKAKPKKKRPSNTVFTQASLQRIVLGLRKADASKSLDPLNATSPARRHL